MVEVETTVDSLRLATNSMPKQQGACRFEGQPATNDNDYEARIVRLLSQVLDGQADAVTDLVNLSFPRLIVLCRARLGKWLQDRDEDVALDVLFHFIRQYQAGVFPQVRDSSGMWGMLRYKVHKRVQRIVRQHITRATRIPISRALADAHEDWASCGRRDSSLDRIEDIEILALFLQWLPQKERELFNLRLAGQSTAQIAKRLGVTSRTIRNWIDRITKLWQQSESSECHVFVTNLSEATFVDASR